MIESDADLDNGPPVGGLNDCNAPSLTGFLIAVGARLNWLNISVYSVRAPRASILFRSLAITSGEKAVIENVFGPIMAGRVLPARHVPTSFLPSAGTEKK
mmetsp:Transcript_67214/g.161048  ORF Transcript_67214/g.161048 Transcript_67214/m.161048 type:complete len:100 (+) Transcript_67214:420-719(+)